jgi:UTP--glucose-1-phosphate uridylyltransferase
MGCEGPKSAIEVRQNLTFLDLTVRQVEYLNNKYGVNIPLVLMNSFNTHDQTLKIVRRYVGHNLTIHCFTQSCYPRLEKDHLHPMPSGPFSEDTKEAWYPPGHGDVYRSIYKSGMLEALQKQGKQYLFISNVDNLGATADLNIMYHIVNAEVDFAVEVTKKTRSDVVGGTLVSYDGRPKLLEKEQVPRSRMDDFRSARGGFDMFNTNNLWVSMKAIFKAASTDALKSEVLAKTVTVDGRQAIQLETAAASYVQCFDNAVGIRVPRTRFLPVKSTSDLLCVQSNLYTVQHGSLIPNPARAFSSLPVVKLGPEFRTTAAFARRVKVVPDMLELDHLTVSGDVWFGRGISLRGTVIVVATAGARIDVPDGSELDNKVVTGNLRILEH